MNDNSEGSTEIQHQAKNSDWKKQMPGKILNKLNKLSGIAFLTAVILILLINRIEEYKSSDKNETAIISCSPLIRKDFATDLSILKNHKKKKEENGNNCPHQLLAAMLVYDNKRKGYHTC